MKKVTLIFLLMSSAFCFGQVTFEKIYGGTTYSHFSCVRQTFDGGYIIGGSIDGFPNSTNMCLIKTDSVGDTLWTKNYGSIDYDFGYSVIQTSDSGYILAGQQDQHGYICVIKTSANGDTLWTKVMYTGVTNYCYSIIQTTDGGYVFTGEVLINAPYSNGHNLFVIKTNSIGDTLWTKIIGPGNTDYEVKGRIVQPTFDNGLIIVGSVIDYYVNPSNYDVFLVKLDSLGDTLWTKSYGDTAGFDVGFNVRQTSDSGFIIAGGTTSYNTSINDYDIYLVKTNSNGDTLWTKTYGDTATNEIGYDVTETNDNNYVVTGANNNSALLMKVNSTGDTLWTRNFGGGLTTVGFSSQQTRDSGYVMVGNISFASNNNAVYLTKTDSFGNSNCIQDYRMMNVKTPTPQTKMNYYISVFSSTSFLHPSFAVNSGCVIADACTLLGIQFPIQNQQSAITIFPNPTTQGQFTIRDSQFTIESIAIYNMLGEKVYTEQLNEKFRLLNTNLNKGFYFVTVKTERGLVTQKLIVE